MQEKFFALDIGTRSVVGIILEKTEDSFYVKDILSKEHTERAMLDGQIHDVLSVSKIIQEIKESLEIKHGTLKKVSVAAAGRALKTERATVSINIEGKPMMQKEDVLHLELSAVQQAQSTVAENYATDSSYHYYCVGYSVLYYRLDGQEIGSLIDQSGSEASAEIIATFLPKVVVESLFSALKRANLEMQALTLEPIAAINVLIPPSMRRLNVALVDIGAGTSDIAITDSGTIIAYGMVPIAGDEITEAISDQLLLDFPLAETAKRQLNEQDSITVTDILGFETSIPKNDIIDQIKPALDKLADAISSELLRLNNEKAPKAIMLVGGGSQTPELTNLLSEKLGLPHNRVAIRGIDAISQLTFADHIQKGPELVTPIGIAIAAEKNPIQYISVTVNGQSVRLFDMKQMTVGDCLLTAGIRINKLYGKPGMAMMVSLNGQTITIPGEHGKKPTLLLNGQPAFFDDEIQSGDVIIAEKGNDGTQTALPVKELIDRIPQKSITINGTNYVIEAVIQRNGFIIDQEAHIADRDNIICQLPETIESLLESLNLDELLTMTAPFSVYTNGKKIQIGKFNGSIKKNGLDTKLNASYEDKDVITIEAAPEPTLNDIAMELGTQLTYSIPVSFNGKRVTLKKNITEFYRDDELLKPETQIKHGDVLTSIQHKMEPFIFQDLFRHVEIDMPQNANGRFILIKNKEETSFYDKLAPGDELRILWPTISKK